MWIIIFTLMVFVIYEGYELDRILTLLEESREELRQLLEEMDSND